MPEPIQFTIKEVDGELVYKTGTSTGWTFFDSEDDDDGPSRTFLNALRDKLKSMLKDKSSIDEKDFDEAFKKARSSAGGKLSSRKKKRTVSDGVSMFEDDYRPKLAKDDEAVAFVSGGGQLNENCGQCRFFGIDTCRLVEGTIEAQDICGLFRERVKFSFSFKDADLHSLTSSEQRDGKSHRRSYVYAVELDAIRSAEVKDGQWIPYLPTPGEFESPRYGTIVITAQRNQNFVENFRSAVYQEKLPIDAEHETKLSGAVAWVTDMRLNDDKSVDAKVDWTDRGRTLMEEDRFKYFSPEFYDEWEDPATGETYADVAIGGALTTRPFFKEKSLRPLVASENGIDILDDDARAHFERKKEEHMTTENKEEKKGIFARIAEALSTTEKPVEEEELRAELRAELSAPLEEGKGKGKETPTEEEIAAAAAAKAASENEPVTAAEVKSLREDLALEKKKTAKLETDARNKRFAELVSGAVKTAPHRWFGEVDANVKMLSELADAVGEDSDVFKTVAKNNSAQAAQIAFGKSIQMKELGYQGTSEVDDGSVEQKVAAEARKLMSEAPDKFKSLADAKTKVWDSHPEWKEQYYAKRQ